jgi:hypothetical protein
MRKLMAIVALLLCGTAGADAAEPGVDIPDYRYCSGHGSDRTILTYDGETLILWTGSTVERLIAYRTLGMGMTGRLLMNEQGTETGEALYYTTIQLIYLSGHEYEPTIFLFRDRVFWPCDRKPTP